jgi:hypothetical protein
LPAQGVGPEANALELLDKLGFGESGGHKQNSKSEARNSKQIQNPKPEGSKLQWFRIPNLGF